VDGAGVDAEVLANARQGPAVGVEMLGLVDLLGGESTAAERDAALAHDLVDGLLTDSEALCQVADGLTGDVGGDKLVRPLGSQGSGGSGERGQISPRERLGGVREALDQRLERRDLLLRVVVRSRLPHSHLKHQVADLVLRCLWGVRAMRVVWRDPGSPGASCSSPVRSVALGGRARRRGGGYSAGGRPRFVFP